MFVIQCSRDGLLLAVEHGIGAGVVVHLHLLIDLHVLASSLEILKQLVDGCREVGALLEQNIELLLATGLVFSRSVGAIHLLLHVVNLQSQDAETVDGPGWLSVLMVALS